MVIEHRVIRVTGTVQGVGFRPFVHRHAVALGLDGWVANDGGTVVIDVQGSSAAIDELVRRIRAESPPLAEVSALDERHLPAGNGRGGFRISDSTRASVADVAVTPDVATCAACLAELRDPSDRRHGHAFITCTDCGPRYTVIRAVPYDRDRTTMAPFAMCAACRREYEDPTDRRFHAEPIACRDCGPRLELIDADGEPLACGDAALEQATAVLARGGIVAVKGLGGFHLAVDATDDDAVGRLRERKSRDDKPFAVMVPDVATAEALCDLDSEASAELSSPRRPIVLAPRRRGGGLSDAVAPGLPELGLMLPYTPVHHLLLERLDRPLVMTSGNRSDEPIVHDDAEVVDRLGSLADGMLVHDRAIHIRCDDSVTRATSKGVQVLRRSRGHAPGRIELPVRAPVPLLAVGAELKSTIAVANDQHLVASHHLGDLEHLAAYQAFEQAIGHLCELTGIEPELVVHDLHPEYLSTKWAVDRGLPTFAVQHHHAHVASCMVEHGRREAVLGIAFDGLGLGTDGTLWGGEFLIADLVSSRRVGHIRPVPQPGGAAAIREPWRMALVWLERAAGAGAAADYGQSVDDRWEAVRSLAGQDRTPTTTSAGRLFDAVAALVGLRSCVSYEGQAAIELEAAAASVDDDDVPVYGMDVDLEGGTVSLDPAPLVARLWRERAAGTAPAVMSAGFHAGFAHAVVRATAHLADRHELDTVALSGGVFQNRRLSRIVTNGLEEMGLEVLVHRRLPPNDGGISIGQAAVAAATIDAGDEASEPEAPHVSGWSR
jgi:hydrogenase maturation protein HypF